MTRKLQRPLKAVLLAGLACGSLYALIELFGSYLYFTVSPPYYLVLHSLLELGTIFISFAIFVVNWEASKQSRSAQSLFVATGFLTVAALGTMHVLSYAGMPDFLTANSAGKAIYFYLLARFWSSLVLLLGAFIPPSASGWHLRRYVLLSVNLLFSLTVLIVVTLFLDRLPAVFLEDQGLTSLKVALEYGVTGLNLLALLAYLGLYQRTRDESIMFMLVALVVGAFGGLAFTLYRNVYDVFNLLGHIYQGISFYLIFRALLVSSVQRPYIQLQVAKDRLEKTVAQLDSRNRVLDALDDVAVTLSSSLKPDEVLEAAIGKVMKVLQAGAGAIFLREDGSDVLRLASWRGLTPVVASHCLAHPMHIQYRQVDDLDDTGLATVLEDPAIVRSFGGALARIAPLRACMCAPIVSKGKVMGAIGMVSDAGKDFSPRDVDLLTAIGYQMGLSIENAQLYERTDERLREKLEELEKAERRSRFLSEAGALLASSVDLDQVLDLVARKTTEVVGDWCAIYLLDEREQNIKPSAFFHPDREELDAIQGVLGQRSLPAGDGPLGRVLKSGEPILLGRVGREETATFVQQFAQSVEEIAVLRSVTPTSCILAPMRARGRAVGVLVVMVTHSHQPLGSVELSLVKALADRAGVAVENSRLLQESQAQRQHLEAIISQMVDGVVVADKGGSLLVANTSAQRMLGDRLEELVMGRGPRGERAAISGKDQQSRHSLVTRALAGELVMREQLKAGSVTSERILSAIASPIRDETGDVSGAVVVLRDVTAEREVERMKEEFVAITSHELRTPITAVLGYSDMLLRGLRGPMTPKQTEAVSSVRSAGQRLLLLINDLLDTSRLEAGKQELERVPVDLFTATERALSSVTVLAASKGLRLVHAVPSGLPRAMADEEQLQRILGNLLSNAVKFTPEGGTVTVSAERKNGAVGVEGSPARPGEGCVEMLSVWVADTGIGIAPENQGQIWEKFQQVDSSSRRLFGGTGLGLAITRSLVELHGGKVWVESDGIPGRGSTFGFTLPVAPVPGARAE